MSKSSSSLCRRSSFSSSSDTSEAFWKKITSNLDIFIACARGRGTCRPLTAKDALNSCSEGNLGRSTQLFYFLLLAPVEKPPAKSQMLTCSVQYLQSYFLHSPCELITVSIETLAWSRSSFILPFYLTANPPPTNPLLGHLKRKDNMLSESDRRAVARLFTGSSTVPRECPPESSERKISF